MKDCNCKPLTVERDRLHQYYNCKPLTVERLRQSAEKIDENNRRGIGGAAWQRGIQEWAADEIELLREALKETDTIMDLILTMYAKDMFDERSLSIAFDELQKRGGSLKAVAVQRRKNRELVG